MSNEEEKEYDIVEVKSSSSLQDVVNRQSVTIMNDSITIKNLTEILLGELTLQHYMFFLKKKKNYIS